MQQSQFDLKDRVAVVTGGYGVLGGSIADGLALAGARIALLGRNQEAAEAKADKLRARGANVITLRADVLNAAVLKEAREKILSTWGQIDILVNAAGGNVTAARTDHIPPFSMPFEAFDEVVRLNLHGTVYPSLIFGEAMAAQRKGSIVNISSMAAQQAISGVMGYSMAKSAIDNFTRWMAVDLAQKCSPELRVNAIAPGFFIANQNRSVLLNADGSPTARAQTIIDQTPMARFGDPSEVQGPVIWLCSDAASFVTGTVISVDGGFSAFSGV